MSSAPDLAVATLPDPGRLRLGNWLLLTFLLDVIAIVRAERHPMDALLLSTISHANVAPISQDVEMQLAFAGADAPPPDALRRPISANALAASLRVPFETVRRRVRALEADGLCVHVHGGFIVPTAVVSSPQYLTEGFRAYERLRRLYGELRLYEALPALPTPVAELKAETFPLRLVARLSTDFILRVMDPVLQQIGDLTGAILFLELIRANMAGLGPEMVGRRAWAEPGLFPNEDRRPVRPAQLASQLNLPQETVRRQAHRLKQAGYCRLTPEGLLVDRSVLIRPEIAGVMRENLHNLDRLMIQLARLGVIRVWEDLEAAARPAQSGRGGA